MPVPVPPVLSETVGLRVLLSFERRMLDIDEVPRAARRRCREYLLDGAEIWQVLEEIEHGYERHGTLHVQRTRICYHGVESSSTGPLDLSRIDIHSNTALDGEPLEAGMSESSLRSNTPDR